MASGGYRKYVGEGGEPWSCRSRPVSQGREGNPYCRRLSYCELPVVSKVPVFTSYHQPDVPAAHTQVVVYVIAERASDLIKSAWK
jgi:hypothetical protein